jgi:hypothetical protein
MIGVLDGGRMVVIEDLRRFKEADTMLLLVVASFLGIPLEYQHCASDSNLTSALIGRVADRIEAERCR